MFLRVRKLLGKVDLFLAGLPLSTTLNDIKSVLPDTARVILKQKIGFVTVDEEDDPQKLLEKLNQLTINGSKIHAKLNLKSFKGSKITEIIENKPGISESPDKNQSLKTEDGNNEEQHLENPQKNQKLGSVGKRFDKKSVKKSDSVLENKKSGIKIKDYNRKIGENQTPKNEKTNDILNSKLAPSKNIHDLTNKYRPYEKSPAQIYKEAIANIKNPFEFHEDYPYRADFSLTSRLKEKKI